jgi:hypothetical protein
VAIRGVEPDRFLTIIDLRDHIVQIRSDRTAR